MYCPTQEQINKYARVLVGFALNSGEGVRPEEVVQCVVPDVAKPLALELQNEILKAGAHPIIRLIPTGFDKDFYSLANESQLKFFPQKYFKARANLIDHQISIVADPHPEELSNIDPQKLFLARNVKKPYQEWIVEKENNGKFTWVVALWGVEARAKMVGLSLESYWEQIIKGCFLDYDQPVKEWRKIWKLQTAIKGKLNKMPIEKIHVEGKDVDLWVSLGEKRKWRGGGGRNIPSFETFTSPDWRGIEGWIRFNEPLNRYGNVIEDVYFEIKKGIVVKATAKRGQKFLTQMLKTKNANKIGEFSLTDKRMSRITHPMAETLFDENIGGPFGNMHLAVGNSYHDCFDGKASTMKKKDWKMLGFNNSAEHTDIVSTTDRKVTAVLKDGSTKTIYNHGQFTL